MAYQNINDCCQKLYFNVIQINKSRGTILETNKSQALCMKSQFQLKNQLGLVLLLHYLLQESQRPNYTHTHTTAFTCCWWSQKTTVEKHTIHLYYNFSACLFRSLLESFSTLVHKVRTWSDDILNEELINGSRLCKCI